ncbi:hypothetical protein RIF29_37955 [Crotalaria pallida]|uniref:SKP1 component POZ domain-containing protein n=1 Tax=Crotalaria pallida TaxID=3830 RepID=A0AAN9HP72_CROPI
MAAENANTMILLKSANNGNTFEVSLKIGKKILIVKAFVEDESFVPTTAIPLQNVNSFELALAIEYLNFHHGETVANLIENKSVHFVRNLFGIVSDFTPEEEERLFQETAWAHEDVDPDV